MNLEIMKMIDFIQDKLIGKGLAYEISTEVGNFVCVDYYPLDVKPIQYAILKDHMHYSTDYPIWAPFIEGHPSPWGNGHFTVNMHLLLEQYNKNLKKEL